MGKGMKGKVFEVTGLAYTITVYRTGMSNYTVQYGNQQTHNLNLGEASKELGQCIFHALQCDGKLD